MNHAHVCDACNDDVVWKHPRAGDDDDIACGAYWAAHARLLRVIRQLERLDEVVPEDPWSPEARAFRRIAQDHYEHALVPTHDAALAETVAALIDVAPSLRGRAAVVAYATLFEHLRRHFPTY